MLTLLTKRRVRKAATEDLNKRVLDVTDFTKRKGWAIMNISKVQMEEAESVLLDLSDRMTERLYERYLEGQIEQDELEEVNKMLSQWSRTGETLLEKIT